MTYQRWGATKFARGQLRIAADNKYLEGFEFEVENRNHDVLEEDSRSWPARPSPSA